MCFQSPPFWYLMTIQEFAVLKYNIMISIQRTAKQFTKYRRAPPRCVHILTVHKHLHLNTNAHTARINTPPTFYKHTICTSYHDIAYKINNLHKTGDTNRYRHQMIPTWFKLSRGEIPNEHKFSLKKGYWRIHTFIKNSQTPIYI